MAKKPGDTMLFPGGAERPVRIKMIQYKQDSSMHDGEPCLKIEQGEHKVFLCPNTMQAILNWYNER